MAGSGPKGGGTVESLPDSGGTDDDRSEGIYKRRVGISLATLAVLAAFIAYVQTGASNQESTTARQATRLASEAQTADVLSKGIQTGLDEVDSELSLLPQREVFGDTSTVAGQFGVAVDPGRADARASEAQDTIEESIEGDRGIPAQFATEAERLSLQQQLVVEQRVSWNAKSSQYDTVLTVLAVAIFLVGFTLVVGRSLRPPLAIPGMLLAIICAGWAAQIYLKPTPDVSEASIDATAEGRYLISAGEPEAAIGLFDVALDSTPDYSEALISRALARLLSANPDLETTLAFTDTSPEVLDAAARDVQSAIDSGAEKDPTAWAVSAVVSVGGGDWDAAASSLEEGIRLNELAPELYLWRSAVATAQGEPEVASGWLTEAAERFGELGEDRVRTLAAQYLTLLEYVAATEPDAAAAAADAEADGVALLARGHKDSPLASGSSPDAAFASAEASHSGDSTDTAVELTGVEDGAQVVVAVFEDPGSDNGWIQSPELFYIGPAAGGAQDGITIRTPRACEPTRFRFDLYVEAEFRDSVTRPGGSATC